MPENYVFCLECQAVDTKSEAECTDARELKTLHVQSISHWAPANIGPYSQAKKVLVMLEFLKCPVHIVLCFFHLTRPFSRPKKKIFEFV